MIFSLTSALMTIYSFNQTSPLNLMTLRFFSILIHDLMLVLYFLCVWYVLLYHSYLLQNFQLFQFSFLQAKGVNHCEVYITFYDTEHQLQENISHYDHHYSIFEIFMNRVRISLTHLIPHKGNLWDTAHPYKLFRWQYLWYDYSLGISLGTLFLKLCMSCAAPLCLPV